MRLWVLFLFLPSLAFPQSVLEADVCIYGATSAGVMAAYTAKKAGKSVVLIEPSRHLGGMTTGGLGATDIGNKFVITGLARDFYRRIGQHYGRLEQWTFEPHVAQGIFRQYLSEASIRPLMAYRIIGADHTTTVINAIRVEPTPDANGRIAPGAMPLTIRARQFIDCTYEGDLMARAGVAYTVGREANSQYGETWNGVQHLDKHQFPNGIDPYKIPGKPESGLVWGIQEGTLAPSGTGDKAVQAYNYRMCLTNDPANRIPITKPDGYDSTLYELLLRQIDKKMPNELTWNLMHFAMMPNHKTDINNCGGLSTDMIGANHDYPEADYARRAEIIKAHEVYTKGFFYFIGHDPRMPKHLRDEMLQWGYPKDEYVDNNHFSPQLYVREARRLVGDYVMTQANCEGKQTVPDAVGMAAYTMDSHNCQRLVVHGANGQKEVQNEGDVEIGGFPPYPVSYRALVPKRGSIQNLLVPVCLSASHIAYGSIRMEPVFMVLAQSAALAACQAIDTRRAIQDIDVNALQNRLATNPLLNGSLPEILLDNDDTLHVKPQGQWTRHTTGGKYGTSMLVAEPAKTGPRSVRFLLPANRLGRYEVYVYNPILKGGGGNPGTYALQTDKADRVTVRIQTGNGLKTQTLNQQPHANDWIHIGDYTLVKGQPPYLEISTEKANGTVVADAVLFKPKS